MFCNPDSGFFFASRGAYYLHFINHDQGRARATTREALYNLLVAKTNTTMKQWPVRIYIHIVFSTKRREPFVLPDIENQLFNYIGGVCKSLECRPIRTGGHRNHVHILCALNKNLSMVELVEEIKIASSRWLRNKFSAFSNFSWQQGYAGFSVSEDELPRLTHYIETQKDHHASMTFEDEFRRMLVESEVEFDEHSVWK